MLKLLITCLLSLLFAFSLCAETKLEKRAAVMQYFANLSREVEALKSKPNLTLEEMKELNKKERLLLDFQGKLLDSLEPVDNPEIVMEIPIPKNKDKQSLTEYENFTTEQKAQLEAKYKIIADLQQRINALEAQKGIQTSQPQAQSQTQQSRQNTKVKRFDFNRAKKKLSNDEIVDYLRNTAHTNINWNFFNNQDNNQIVDILSANSDGIEIYDIGVNQETLKQNILQKSDNINAQQDSPFEFVSNTFAEFFNTKGHQERVKEKDKLSKDLMYLDIDSLSDEELNTINTALGIENRENLSPKEALKIRQEKMILLNEQESKIAQLEAELAQLEAQKEQEMNTYDPNYINAIANYSNEERETFWSLIWVLQSSEEVLSMLKQESGFWNWFDRKLNKWTNIWGLDANQVTFVLCADDIRRILYEYKFKIIEDKYDYKDSKLFYGVDGVTSFATNINTMKSVLEDALREIYLMNLPITKMQQKAIETAEQNLAYLKSLKSPNDYNESAIIKNKYY